MSILGPDTIQGLVGEDTLSTPRLELVQRLLDSLQLFV